MIRTAISESAPRDPAARAAGSRWLIRSAALVLTMVLSAVAIDGLAKQSKPPADEQRPFVISGEIDGVVPAVASSLPVRLDNPNRFDLSVRTLTVTVADARPGCAADNLVVGAPTLPVTIPANGHAVARVPVRFVDDPANACQGAEFPLTYSGTAAKAASRR